MRKKKFADGEFGGPYTNGELFEVIHKRLEEKKLLPSIEYALPENRSVAHITHDDGWDVICEVRFGGSEGIYLSVFAEGTVTDSGTKDRLHLGTYKTLNSDKSAYLEMVHLQTEFVFETMDYVRTHEDRFNWVGSDMRFRHNGSEPKGGYCSVKTLEQISKLFWRAREWDEKQNPDRVVDSVAVTNNNTGVTETYFAFFPHYGGKYLLRLAIDQYEVDGSMAITAECLNEDGWWWEPFCTMTVHLDAQPADGAVFLDANNIPNIGEFFTRNGLGQATGRMVASGFAEYPEYKINLDALRSVAYDR